MALKATRDPHAVRRRLGHSHVSTTIGIYGYALEEGGTVAWALDRLIHKSSCEAEQDGSSAAAAAD